MAALLNIPRLGGYTGELRAHKSFLEGLPDGSIVLSDVMLPTLKEIAQVQLVQKMGKEVSSIAVRNRRGQISGRERDRMWNWRLDRKKDTFPNQNSQARETSRWNLGPKSGPDGCLKVCHGRYGCSFLIRYALKLVPRINAAGHGESDESDFATQSQSVAQLLKVGRLKESHVPTLART